MKKIIFIALLLLQNIFLTHAEVRLPAILTSHMVLQQNSNVTIWGWSEPSEKISIKTDWDTTAYFTKGGSDAKWKIQIKTPSAGGPYKIFIKGYNTIILDDILIGEVWDCSGQSNMEMSYNWGVKEYSADIKNAYNPNIRLFHIPKLTSDYPQDDTKGKWVICDSQTVKGFSLAGYFFGKKLQESLHVPIGLINASWGGTPAEAWTPKDSVESIPILKEAATHLVPNPGWPVKPAATFNAMIYPITNFTIAGAIWYQGEANVGTALTYKNILTTMINSWRAAWKKNFPFYYVEIAPFAGYGNTISSALLREQQTQTLSLPNTGMVVIHDLVTDLNDIHPKNKKDVGLRLANYALAETYNKKGIVYKSPMYKSMQVEKNKIWINFYNVDKGLMSKESRITEFYISGEDKHFVPANVKIEGNSVVVWNESVKHPVAVRFGFTNSAIPNLFSKEGLPVNIFRTDNWNDVNTIPAK